MTTSRSFARIAVWQSCLLVVGCGGHDGPRGVADAGPDAAADAAAPEPDGGEPDAALDAGPPPPVEDAWCARLAAGPGGTRAFAVDLSAAHADVRFFGPSDDHDVADQALAASLAAPEALSERGVEALGLALADVCALAADERPLGSARVESHGDVALVTPGTGEVVLPEGTRAVAVDLRDLPAVPGLAPLLEAAVTPALTEVFERPRHVARSYGGMPDEVFLGRTNVYGRALDRVRVRQIQGHAPVDLPLALLVGERIAPEAAELAGVLRLAGRAWIFGREVPAAVAEARWTGVGASGLAPRVADLLQDGRRWPDVVPADRSLDEGLEALLAELPGLGNPEVPSRDDEGARSWLEASAVDVPRRRDQRLGLGEARAALLIAHGAARLFFPYFPVVGDVIDERLGEVLDSLDRADATDRIVVRDLLRRFGHALSDGHQFVADWASPMAGGMPFYPDHLDGWPVVIRSVDETVLAGDVVVGIGGVPADEWYALELARTSAATPGYRLDLASRLWRGSAEALSLDLRGFDGTTRTVVVDPLPANLLGQVGWEPVLREEGPCDDLDAPGVYYVNLASEVMASNAQFHSALEDAAAATGLVVDMRGYPTIDHYEVVERLVPDGSSSPIFRVPTRSDPAHVSWSETRYNLPSLTEPSFAGPIVLLVGPVTVSAAENFATMLVGAGHVTVVGRQSAGTNGNITGVQLPGGFSFSFTGMEVLYPDRSRFHGVGIVPDVEVVPTAEDYATGNDPELRAAIELLQ